MDVNGACCAQSPPNVAPQSGTFDLDDHVKYTIENHCLAAIVTIKWQVINLELVLTSNTYSR